MRERERERERKMDELKDDEKKKSSTGFPLHSTRQTCDVFYYVVFTLSRKKNFKQEKLKMALDKGSSINGVIQF